MKTLYFDNKTHSLCAIDQTKLPQKLQYIYISDVTMLYDAIKTLKIRGAPAIGVGAALGLLFGVMLNGCGLWESHAIGLALGPLWGMALAMLLPEKPRDDEPDHKS